MRSAEAAQNAIYHRRFKDNHHRNGDQNGTPVGHHGINRQGYADRHEKQAEEQPTERFHVRFEFVTERGISQHHTRDEGAHGIGHTGHVHQQGREDDNAQREGRHDFRHA